jgi:hypothetical protein
MFLRSRKFISQDILKKIEQANSDKPVKLIELCRSLNTNYSKGHYITVVILIRAILDYLPPVFGHNKTSQVYSNLSGNRSFKDSLKALDEGLRAVGGDALHNSAHKTEALKVSKVTCDIYRDNLKNVLDVVADQLRAQDLRPETQIRRGACVKEKVPKTEVENFKNLIKDIGDWYVEHLDDEKVWINQKDSSYQVVERGDREDFSEPWTQVYPDREGSGKYSVDLLHNGNHIKRFTFVYCDGGRVRVVMPSFRKIEGKGRWFDKDLYGATYEGVDFVWERTSLEYDLMNMIGDFYVYKSVEGVAGMSGITLI